ncbi:MAG: hypothetical protein AAF604_08595 [Acidobacteriota bacterium]
MRRQKTHPRPLIAWTLILGLALSGAAFGAQEAERESLWNRIFSVIERVVGSEAPPPEEGNEAGSDMDPNGLRAIEDEEF